MVTKVDVRAYVALRTYMFVHYTVQENEATKTFHRYLISHRGRIHVSSWRLGQVQNLRVFAVLVQEAEKVMHLTEKVVCGIVSSSQEWSVELHLL